MAAFFTAAMGSLELVLMNQEMPPLGPSLLTQSSSINSAGSTTFYRADSMGDTSSQSRFDSAWRRYVFVVGCCAVAITERLASTRLTEASPSATPAMMRENSNSWI